jgi:hypothetical protein
MSCDALLTALLGKWRTHPTNRARINSNDIQYGATISFQQPPVKTKSRFLLTETTSWPEGKEGTMGMHYDVGVLKCTDEDTLQWSLAHNFGGTEILSGPVIKDLGGHFGCVMRSTSIAGASSFTKTRRVLNLSSGLRDGVPILSQTFAINFGGGDLEDHLFESYVKAKVQ